MCHALVVPDAVLYFVVWVLLTSSYVSFLCPQMEIGGILFLSCLCVCVSVCLSVCLCVRNFNLAYNFFVSQGILTKLHTLVHHHKSYILTKGRNSKNKYILVKQYRK